MVIRGAPAIGVAAALGVALAATRASGDASAVVRAASEACDLLAATRPTAVNLFWAVDRMRRCLASAAGADAGGLCRALLAEALAVREEDIAMCRRMGSHGAALVPDRATILTHCNAGALATAGHGTALGVVRSAVEQGKTVRVLADETRPLLQGARLTAWELMQDNIPMTLIADNVSGMLMRAGRVDLVLFGADRAAANGDVANKIGSYNIAVLAHEHGIPCYSVVPTPTIDLSLAHGDLIPIEERGWDEVAKVGTEQIAPDGVPVYNPAFDVTPHRYLTGIITEEGVCYPPFEVSLRRAVDAAEARRGGGSAGQRRE
jgi:methylthioribose-1-phosphate isomerase